MAVLDKSLDIKILNCAKEEFLKYGFIKANLRRICRNAGVTTGAVYTRYKGKDGLFGALVDDTLLKMNEKVYHSKKIIDIDDTNEHLPLYHNSINLLMEFLYQHYDAFRLLRCCSEGSPYSDFLHVFIEKNTEYIWNYLKTHPDHNQHKVDYEELHLILTTFWVAIFEPISHEFSKERAIHYCEIMMEFFNWQAIIKFEEV